MPSIALRAFVYVDGFNLYYRALKRTRYKWLDLHALSQDLLGPQSTIEGIRYFTAPVSGKEDRETAIRQQRYLLALGTLPKLTVHLGNFLTSVKVRQLETPLPDGTTHVRVLHTEEKGADVNLATHLVNDAWEDRFDVALIFSQDTDLLEPVRLVQDKLGKKLGVVVLDGQGPGKLAAAGGFRKHLTHSRLAAAQLPPVVSFGRKGKMVHQPEEWK